MYLTQLKAIFHENKDSIAICSRAANAKQLREEPLCPRHRATPRNYHRCQHLWLLGER